MLVERYTFEKKESLVINYGADYDLDGITLPCFSDLPVDIIPVGLYIQ